MKIGIMHRLFLSILTATCLAIISMFLIMLWNIDRGFHQYLRSVDQGMLEQAVSRFETAYREHGNWNFFRERPRYWAIRLLSGPPDTEPGGEHFREPKPGDIPPYPSPPPPGIAPRPPAPRFIVLDAMRKPLLGNPSDMQDSRFMPIMYGGEIVGYIGLHSPRHFLAPHQKEFLRQQNLFLAFSALVVVLVSMIVSFPLANRLVRPIRAIADATGDIASGRYTVRIPVTSSDELGHLARSFNEMALTLEKNEKDRRQWVADISHELRTPLTVLRGEIEALQDGIRQPTPDAIRSLHAEVIRLSRLTDDLYQLSLTDIGALTYRKEKTDIAEVLEDAVSSFIEEFSGKKIAVTRSIFGKDPVYVFGDAERLRRLFTNILDNALKYTDEGGVVSVTIECRDGQVFIDFKDSEPGVPEEQLGKLFDRLYRVDSARSRETGGAGLGLAICRNIAEAHDGSISAHPSSLGGIWIRLSIPLMLPMEKKQ